MTESSREIHDRVEAEDRARRHVAASARWRAFADLPEAEGKVRTAINFANNTDMTTEEARRALRSAPLDEQQTSDQATEEESQEAYMAGMLSRARQREERA